MDELHGFQLIRRQDIREMKTAAALFRHIKTGAELVSLENDDNNKVFGITFRTPPADSTGVAHILEHSVLCGSRKYPLKEPFVELLKGSLQTFLNAMTFPDRTCYPVASQNLKDFFNLIDVYLDAVFYPRLTPQIFQQEGWHYELAALDGALSYKGVVFNEMKGAYSSPEGLLSHYSQQSLFPDSPYGLDSGGDPAAIPDLTYDDFLDFHKRFYHPSNSRLYFYGDDDPAERLRIADTYLKEFDHLDIDSSIRLQPPFAEPLHITKPFPSGNAGAGPQGMVTVNWLLGKTTDVDMNLALGVLEYMLLEMPGSPLKKALLDSGYGDGIAGVGLDASVLQMYFSTGLKGVEPACAGKVEQLVLEALEGFARDGFAPQTVAAAVNSVEFRLRERNSGNFPRGLVVLMHMLTTWIYGGDPFALLAFDAPLTRLKERLKSSRFFFEELLQKYFVTNLHRSVLVLVPDEALAEHLARDEQARLAQARDAMGADQLEATVENTCELHRIQQTPDPPEALATIACLKHADLDKSSLQIPCEPLSPGGATLLYHDLFTSNIFYCDVGLNARLLPQHYLPYVSLWGRCLLEMGTAKQDFVALSQRIHEKTGGITTNLFSSVARGGEGGASWLFLRGRAVVPRACDLLNIFSDVLLSTCFNNRDRFKQILLQEKAAMEQKLIPMGHSYVNSRLRARFHETDWAHEQMSGISYLQFLRDLASRVDRQWDAVRAELEAMGSIMVRRRAVVVNVTVDAANWGALEPGMASFLEGLPDDAPAPLPAWSRPPVPEHEALVIPSMVNYVGKGVNLFEHGYRYSGQAHPVTHYLRTTWLWERVRVQGGAYGAFVRLDRFSGGLTLFSYRDPNVLKTIDLFDQAARFLADSDVSDDEVLKSIIGTIAEVDAPMLPDARGYVSMQRYLCGNTDESRQQMRDEILAATAADFRSFGETMQAFSRHGNIAVLGSEKAIQEANRIRNGQFAVSTVM